MHDILCLLSLLCDVGKSAMGIYLSWSLSDRTSGLMYVQGLCGLWRLASTNFDTAVNRFEQTTIFRFFFFSFYSFFPSSHRADCAMHFVVYSVFVKQQTAFVNESITQILAELTYCLSSAFYNYTIHAEYSLIYDTFFFLCRLLCLFFIIRWHRIDR